MVVTAVRLHERLKQLLVGQICVVVSHRKPGRGEPEVEPRVKIDDVTEHLSIISDRHATYCGHCKPEIDVARRRITFQSMGIDDTFCDIEKRSFTVVNTKAGPTIRPIATPIMGWRWKSYTPIRSKVRSKLSVTSPTDSNRATCKGHVVGPTKSLAKIRTLGRSFQ